MSEKQRAFLKWAGGKYRLAQDIRKNLPPSIPQGACFVEPFVGAGSVFLNTDFDRYLLADINPDLINLFNAVKNDVEHYIQQTQALFLASNANSKSFYLARRAEFNASEDPFQRSVLFLYLNRFGFNGLCRYNKKRGYNVPFGRYKTHYFPEKELRFFAQKAQKAEFICADFEQVFAYLREKNDNYIVYCDPPYHDRDKKLYEGTASAFDHCAFYDWCVRVSKTNPIFISEYSIEDDRFEIVAEKQKITSMAQFKSSIVTERLYTVKK